MRTSCKCYSGLCLRSCGGVATAGTRSPRTVAVGSNSAVPLEYPRPDATRRDLDPRRDGSDGLLEQIEKISPLKMSMVALREVNITCIGLRRPEAAAEAEVSRAKTKAFKDALSKVSDTVVSSLVVVTVASPPSSATVASPSKPATESPAKAADDPEFDFGEALMCYECDPQGMAYCLLERRVLEL